jgi:hypothetical protein
MFQMKHSNADVYLRLNGSQNSLKPLMFWFCIPLDLTAVYGWIDYEVVYPERNRKKKATHKDTKEI